MFELSIDNFKAVYHANTIPFQTGRSFLFCTAAALVLNGGNVYASLATGGTFAALTFTASVISPIVAGLFGESSNQPVGKFKACLIDAAVLITAVLVASVALNIYINPFILGISIVLPLILNKHNDKMVGQAIPIMSIPAALASHVWALIG